MNRKQKKAKRRHVDRSQRDRARVWKLREKYPRLYQRFVTAQLDNKSECRQGWVIQCEPLVIRGESGREYLCEGTPILVDNPPRRTVSLEKPHASIQRTRR